MTRRSVRWLLPAALALAVLIPGSAQATTYNCKKMACVNRTLTALEGQIRTLQTNVATDTQAIKALANCVVDLPVTIYGDPSGTYGYAFSSDGASTFYTTGLDATASGDNVSAWFLADACNTQATASIAHTAALRPFGPIAPRIAWPWATRQSRP